MVPEAAVAQKRLAPTVAGARAREVSRRRFGDSLRAVITLYQFEISPFCDKVRRVLHLKGQAYTVREVTLGETGRGFIKKLHPSNKLPIIDHDGTIVADSTHIVAYLERAFPEPSLYPTDARDRAIAHILEDWADESLYFYEMCMRFTFPHNAEKWLPELLKHDGGVMRALARRLVPRTTKKQLAAQGTGRKGRERVAQEAAAHIAAVGDYLGDNDWLAGGAISVADIAVFAQLYCLRGTEEGARQIASLPPVQAWMQRVDEATAAP